VSQSPSSSQSPSLSPSSSQSPSSRYATCGSGYVGNWQCPDPNACCSRWGWCGYGVDYCGYSLSYATDGDNWDDDNLYSNSNQSPKDPIANESHQQSVHATATYALAGASSSSSTTTKKPPKQICYYPGNKKCPKIPQKSTATSCSC